MQKDTGNRKVFLRGTHLLPRGCMGCPEGRFILASSAYRGNRVDVVFAFRPLTAPRCSMSLSSFAPPWFAERALQSVTGAAAVALAFLALSLVVSQAVADEEMPAGAITMPEAKSEFASKPAERTLHARRKLLHNTWEGPSGGLRIVDASGGATGTYRVMLGVKLFGVNDWLEPEAHHFHAGTVLALAWTPLDFLEVFSTTTTWRDSIYAVDRSFFQVLGDTRLGAKGYVRPLPWLTAGGDVTLKVPFNTLVDLKQTGRSMSYNLRGNVSVDLRELDHRASVPFIGRLNVGYWFDNSANLVSRLERARYAELGADADPAVLPPGEEDRHLLSPGERYALQVNRTDRVVIGLGTEIPMDVQEIATTFSLITEWTLELPVNRQGFSCPEGPGGNSPSCNAGGMVQRQALTVGLRVLPPLPGLSLSLATDIGLAGTGPGVHAFHAQAPYAVLLGIGYSFDPRTQRPKASK